MPDFIAAERSASETDQKKEIPVDEFLNAKSNEIREKVTKYVLDNPRDKEIDNSVDFVIDIDYDSIAAKLTADLAADLIRNYGYTPEQAIAIASHSVLPPYDHDHKFSKQINDVNTIEESIAAPGSFCRTCEPLGSKVAVELGYVVTRWGSNLIDIVTGEQSTHTFSTIKTPDGTEKFIDTTNSYYGDFLPDDPTLGVFKGFRVRTMYKMETHTPNKIED